MRDEEALKGRGKVGWGWGKTIFLFGLFAFAYAQMEMKMLPPAVGGWIKYKLSPPMEGVMTIEIPAKEGENFWIKSTFESSAGIEWIKRFMIDQNFNIVMLAATREKGFLKLEDPALIDQWKEEVYFDMKRYQLKGMEKVKVPAGEFNAYHYVALDGVGINNTMEFWLTEELKLPVYFQGLIKFIKKHGKEKVVCELLDYSK